MENEKQFKQVAFIILRKEDGGFILNVPLYVKVKEVKVNGLIESEEELIDRVSETMINHYEQRLRELAMDIKNKKQQGETER